MKELGNKEKAANKRWDKICKKKPTQSKGKSRLENSNKVLFSPVVTHYCPTKQYYNDEFKASLIGAFQIKNSINETITKRSELQDMRQAILQEIKACQEDLNKLVKDFHSLRRAERRKKRAATNIKVATLNDKIEDLSLAAQALIAEFIDIDEKQAVLEQRLAETIKEQDRLLAKKAAIRQSCLASNHEAEQALPVKPAVASRMLHLRDMLKLPSTFLPMPLKDVKQVPVGTRYSRLG